MCGRYRFFFGEKYGNNRLEVIQTKSEQNEHVSETSELKICSYNCKNVKTSDLIINEMFKTQMLNSSNNTTARTLALLISNSDVE